MGVAAFGSAPFALGAEGEDPAVLRPFHAANGLANRGLHELAIEEYESFLAASPNHTKAPTARYGLAVCLARLNRFDEALAQLKPLEGRDDFEFAAEVDLLLGQSLLTLGRAEEAVPPLKRIVERRAQHDVADDAAPLYVESLHRAGAHEAAIAACANLVKRWPEHPQRSRAELFAGLSEMQERDFTAAAERFERMLQREPEGPYTAHATLLAAQSRQNAGQMREAVTLYRKVRQRDQAQFLPEALAGLGPLLRLEGNLDEAAAALERLLADFGDAPAADEAALELARVRFEQGDYDRAAALFEQALKEGRTSRADAAEYWLAKCDLRRDQAQRCAQRLAKAIKAHPESELIAEMRYDLAVALLRAEEAAAAEEALEAFLAQHGKHELAPAATRQLASLQHARGGHDEALKTCRTFLGEWPKDPAANEVAFLEAECLFFSDELDEASKKYAVLLQRRVPEPFASRAAYRVGVAAHRRGEMDAAAASLNRVASGRSTPEEFRPALHLLGDIAFQQERWGEARDALSDYLSFGLNQPGADDALLKLGVARHRLGDHKAAIETLDILLVQFKESPHRIHAMFEKGQALVALERDDEAAVVFRETIALDPESRFASHAHARLGAIAMRKGDAAAAAASFELAARSAPADSEAGADAALRRGQALLAAGEHAEAVQTLSQFLTANPKHPRAHEAAALRALALSRGGDGEEALQAITEVERKGLDRLEPQTRISLLYEKAWRLREAGKPGEAAEAYEALLALNPPADLRAHALVERAAIDADQDRHDAAAKGLRAALETLRGLDEPPAALLEQARYRLGVAEFNAEHPGPAAEALEEFLKFHGESDLAPAAALLAGECLLKTGDAGRAAEHLKAARDGLSEDADRRAQATLRLAEALSERQRWPDAERIFGEFLDEYSNHPLWFQARFGQGWAREHQRRLDEAIEAYRDVVDRHDGPTAARAQFQVGECLFALGRHDEAVRELLKVDILYAYPEWSAAALYEAGRALEATNKFAEARAQYERVKQRHPDTEWARMAESRLAVAATPAVPGR